MIIVLYERSRKDQHSLSPSDELQNHTKRNQTKTRDPRQSHHIHNSAHVQKKTKSQLCMHLPDEDAEERTAWCRLGHDLQSCNWQRS
ncbi:hypothetical protein PF005_g22549 [Phytophthora fragariae]|uniref:Uncharacterized protein n=1 Tax=Phytophthora fragariae TaxID=53985 RepID=A0A6A3EBH3_9STRA|nr:hypothetical protein PF003_g18185 [Phytophthora fragariae]KAE8927408.1 hypothetical protein PF009_g22422 [Phytophthora fragariae]KAE8984325.1 hypothetical protein PF011_g20820 [Phytophthora fragariae]KAE9105858.1 hypothetical protein PF006_g21503 [Phytophthora fragariae]KAE9182290.1 hypothetical protein PF005_g22549 [Phytophthora fragariae]